MPKSKEILDSEDDLSSNEEEKPKKRARTEKKTQEDTKTTKKTKTDSKTSKSKSKKEEDEQESDSNDSGPVSDGMYMLAKMRFVNVSEFKGKSYVNIREYYEKDGKTLPGKKGISLSVDQWENLKKHIAQIDGDIKKNK